LYDEHRPMNIHPMRRKQMSKIVVSRDELADFCRRHHIRRLSFFGSILREDFSPESDVDVLVEFESGHIPGFMRLFEIEQEFSGLVGGARPDFVTFKALNRRIQDRVLAEAEVQYAQG
jgi:predicted nucleotidyltransferase